jgi:mRNA interferase RelE/StbE
MSDEPKHYTLRMMPGAKRDIRRIDPEMARRIVEKLLVQAENATTIRHKALKGRWHGLYSLRVGDYRAIYALRHDEQLLVVEVIGHRRDVYDE